VNPLLAPLAAAFGLGVQVRHAAFRHGWFKTQRLSAPVISVGNLTVGGTGKTPLVALVARVLLRCGWTPSILTRGYARQSKADLIVVAPTPERLANARDVGDEPAILARALPEVPLVICSDRFRGGRVAEELFKVDLHILDDGFQHLALRRDLDVVALDSTRPLADLALLPAGRAREPLAALARAQIAVITRVDSGRPQPLEERVREVNSGIEIFHSSTALVGLADAATGSGVATESLRVQKAAAFCGIANSRAFFQDLRRWGFSLVAEDAFPDHHVYTEREIRGLVAGAQAKGAAALLTTEKDAVKLARGWRPELPIVTCSIVSRVLEGEAFERTLLTYLERAKRADG